MENMLEEKIMDEQPIITDEVTLLREKIDELSAKVTNLTLERNGAFCRVGELQDVIKGKNDLLYMTVDDNIKQKKEIAALKRKHADQVEKVLRRAYRMQYVILGIGATVGIALGVYITTLIRLPW